MSLSFDWIFYFCAVGAVYFGTKINQIAFGSKVKGPTLGGYAALIFSYLIFLRTFAIINLVLGLAVSVYHLVIIKRAFNRRFVFAGCIFYFLTFLTLGVTGQERFVSIASVIPLFFFLFFKREREKLMIRNH